MARLDSVGDPVESPSAGSGCCISLAELYGSPPALTIGVAVPDLMLSAAVPTLKPTLLTRHRSGCLQDAGSQG